MIIKKFWTILFVVIIAILLGACTTTTTARMAVIQPVLKDMIVTFVNSESGAPETITQPRILLGDQKYMSSGGAVTIVPVDNSSQLQVSVSISKSKQIGDGYVTLTDLQLAEFQTGNGGYEVTFNGLKTLGLIDNERVMMVESPTDNFRFEVRFHEPLSWFAGGFKTPVLYRIHGPLGEFSLANFSPTVAVNLAQVNFKNRSFD